MGATSLVTSTPRSAQLQPLALLPSWRWQRAALGPEARWGGGRPKVAPATPSHCWAIRLLGAHALLRTAKQQRQASGWLGHLDLLQLVRALLEAAAQGTGSVPARSSSPADGDFPQHTGRPVPSACVAGGPLKEAPPAPYLEPKPKLPNRPPMGRPEPPCLRSKAPFCRSQDCFTMAPAIWQVAARAGGPSGAHPALQRPCKRTCGRRARMPNCAGLAAAVCTIGHGGRCPSL
jgi:hypothetical protein